MLPLPAQVRALGALDVTGGGGACRQPPSPSEGHPQASFSPSSPVRIWTSSTPGLGGPSLVLQGISSPLATAGGGGPHSPLGDGEGPPLSPDLYRRHRRTAEAPVLQSVASAGASPSRADGSGMQRREDPDGLLHGNMERDGISCRGGVLNPPAWDGDQPPPLDGIQSTALTAESTAVAVAVSSGISGLVVRRYGSDGGIAASPRDGHAEVAHQPSGWPSGVEAAALKSCFYDLSGASAGPGASPSSPLRGGSEESVDFDDAGTSRSAAGGGCGAMAAASPGRSRKMSSPLHLQPQPPLTHRSSTGVFSTGPDSGSSILAGGDGATPSVSAEILNSIPLYQTSYQSASSNSDSSTATVSHAPSATSPLRPHSFLPQIISQQQQQLANSGGGGGGLGNASLRAAAFAAVNASWPMKQAMKAQVGKGKGGRGGINLDRMSSFHIIFSMRALRFNWSSKEPPQFANMHCEPPP